VVAVIVMVVMLMIKIIMNIVDAVGGVRKLFQFVKNKVKRYSWSACTKLTWSRICSVCLFLYLDFCLSINLLFHTTLSLKKFRTL